MRSFYPSLSISAPFYGYLKLLKLHGKETSQSKDVRSLDRTQDLIHQGRALTDCATLAPKGASRSTAQSRPRWSTIQMTKFSYIVWLIIGKALRGKEFWNGLFIPSVGGLTLTPSYKTERNSFAILVLSPGQGRSYDFSEGGNTVSHTRRATFTYGVRKFVTEIHARRRTKYVVYKSQWMPLVVPRAFLRRGGPSPRKSWLWSFHIQQARDT